MYFERVKETTTTTGTGALTLAGAVAQAVAFQSVVPTGDPVDYTLVDANGTGWESGIGTLASPTSLTRDTVLSSSASGSAITLSTGTHTVLLGLSGDAMNRRDVFGDRFLDHVVSGLVGPTTSGTLAGTMSAGVAYVLGSRVNKSAQTKTYTASKDTYIDLSNKAVVTYVEVANNASAPAVTANSMRLWKTVTSGSAITSGTDLRNLVDRPCCVLASSGGFSQTLPNSTSTAISFNSTAYESVNNASMHSATSNPTRITVTAPGLYLPAGFANIGPISSSGSTPWYAYVLMKLNGTTQINGSFITGPNSTYPAATVTGPALQMATGDYVELYVIPNDSGGSASETCVAARMSLHRVA